MDLNQQFPPDLISFTDSGDFDYGAFLQGEDIDFGESAQGNVIGGGGFSDDSGKATPPSSDNRSTSNASAQVVRRQPAQKQRLERRGHTKSRRGCYNCKRRRIKCQETRPSCGHCVKTGLKCEYPAPPQITNQPHQQLLFTLQDMRFFQHFLTQCYPHHPLKQEEIWTHEIPCIAHNHEFLMHAILGFSASQLIASDASVIPSAMGHRVKAIKAIKKRLAETSKTTLSYEEANAMVATCYALTFQSVSLDDGLAEYMTFIRGIMIVGVQMMFRKIKPIFGNMLEEDQDNILEPLMGNLPLIQKAWTDAALDALNNLKPLCLEQIEIDYHRMLVDIVEKLYVNSWDAYKAYTKHYGWWMLLPHNEFHELTNYNNQVILLLHSHWISINEIMAFITQHEQRARSKAPDSSQESADIDPGFQRWLKYTNSQIDYEHQIFNQWPMWVEEQLTRDISFFGKTM